MQPAKYDARMVQAAQSRQLNSLNGSRKYLPLPRGSTGQSSSSMYPEDSYNEGSNGDRYWEETAATQQTGVDKPTGLRHFSTKVCEKVKEKGLTNYNEVADELVTDYFQSNVLKHIDVVKQEYDMKNIRRRVYDALNVLLAMNIITKNKKDIRWIGLPASASQEITRLEEEKARREASIKTKMKTLQDMVMQIVAYKNLVERNRKHEHEHGRPDKDSVLHLPFLIINTDKEANVECSVSSDKSEFLFSFDKRFEIHDDFEVLKKMKMACGLDTGTSTEEDIKTAKGFLPELHQHYIDEIIEAYKRAEEEKEEQKKQQAEVEASQMQYFEQQMQTSTSQVPQTSRFNRQLQEHLMNDGSEDHSAVAGITEKEMPVEEKDVGPIARVPMYNYSPQKGRPLPSTSGMPQQSSSMPSTSTTRRYYVQKTPQGTIKREMSPAVRTVTRPYPAPMSTERRMATGGGTVNAPVKYYVQQGQNPMQYPQTAQRYRVRPPPQPTQSNQPQRVVYTTSSPANQLPPGGSRIISQRIVGPGGPHPPGTIIRKVIRKVVVNSNAGGQKQSPAQQVIQKKMMEQQDILERKPDQPMTSAQAAALIQHPQHEEYDYY